MDHTFTRQILVLVLVLFSPLLTFGTNPPLPVATLDTDNLLPNQMDSTFTTVTFSSETIIEIVACPTVYRDASCPFAVFKWENGVLQYIVQAPKLTLRASSSSSNGQRVLLDFNNRKVSRPQHILDDARAVWTFGMIYPEDVNREIVRVVDTATRKTCFDWSRTFAMTYSRRKSAGISPSGEFVAIKEENHLSVYRVPSTCDGPKVTRRKLESQ